MKNLNNIKYNLEELFFSKYDNRTPFEKIIGYCDNCDDCPGYPKGRCLFAYPKTVRLDTMYEDEKSNYFTGCNSAIENMKKRGKNIILQEDDKKGVDKH